MSQATEQIARQFANGSVNRIIWGDILHNVKVYGAKGDGVADDSNAIRAAINALPDIGGTVYLPAGTYLVRSDITVGNKFVTIKGDGKNSTIIKVPIGFPTNALGVFIFNAGEPSGIIRDIQITFDQLDTSVRANLYAFPPAIYAQNQPRLRVLHCRIVKAMMGLDLKGNTGGAFIHDVELSALSIGIDLDGAMDSVRISNCHLWKFDLSNNQFQIYEELATIGINCGRVDDLHLTDTLIFAGTGLKMYGSASGQTFGEIVSTDFDAHLGIDMSAGQLNVTSCNFTVSKNIYQSIKLTGGQLLIGQCWFYASGGIANGLPLIQLIGTTDGEMLLDISGCFFNSEGVDISSIETQNVNNVIIQGNHFRRLLNIAYTKPTIKIGGGRATIMGNRTKDKGAGAGTFIQVVTDDYHRVVYNAAPGWTYTTPAGAQGIYTPN